MFDSNQALGAVARIKHLCTTLYFTYSHRLKT